MMGPDYAWWHGFYDLKRTYQHIMHLAETAREKSHGSPAFVPGSGGENLTPVALESLPVAWKQIKDLVGYKP